MTDDKCELTDTQGRKCPRPAAYVSRAGVHVCEHHAAVMAYQGVTRIEKADKKAEVKK